MLTLTEAQKYTVNKVVKGVLKEIIKDCRAAQLIPWAGIMGNALQYLREAELPTGNFYDPNETWTEETGRVYQVTAGIKIMGKDADIDNFLTATRSDYTDIEAETIQMSAKGVKHSWQSKMWYGDNSASSKEFDGIHRLYLTGAEGGTELTAQSLHIGSGSTGDALAAADMDVTMDMIRDGNPSCIVTTRNIRRRINAYLRGKNNIYYTKDEFGQMLTSWGDVPIYIDDFLVQTEAISSGKYSAKTGGVTGSLFFLTFDTDATHGIQNGSLSTRKLGQLFNKDSVRWRIRWYVGLCLKRTIRNAIIDGITDAAMTDT